MRWLKYVYIRRTVLGRASGLTIGITGRENEMDKVILTVGLIGLEQCSPGFTYTTHREMMPTLAECREVADELLKYRFVQSTSCEQVRQKTNGQ